jgi:hypothetical protein
MSIKIITLVCFLSFFLKLNAQQNCNDTVNFYVYYQGCPQEWDTLTIYTFTTGGNYTSSELGNGINPYQNTSPNNEIIGGTNLTFIEFYDFYGPWNQYYTFNYILNGCTYTDSIFVGSVIGPYPNSITSQPTSQTISCGSNPNPFSISTTGSNTYQWFSSTDGLTFSTINNATSNSFTPPNSQIGTTYYFCQVSNNYPDCYSLNSINSDTVTLNSLQTATITSQPLLTQNVCQNSTASPLIVAVDNPNATFQWYSNTINSNSGGIPISGATSNSYTPTTTIAGTTYYYCIINGCNNIFSVVSEVNVNATPEITNLPQYNITTCGTLQINQHLQTSIPSDIYISANYSGAWGNYGSGQGILWGGILNDQVNTNSYCVGQQFPSTGSVTYSLTPISYFGCIGDTSYWSNFVSPYPFLCNIANNYTLCSGDSLDIFLDTNNNFNYTWYAIDNPNVSGESTNQSSNSINDVLVNNSGVNQTVNYYYTIYAPPTYYGISCPSTSGFSVTIKPSPTINIPNETICNGTSTQLVGNGAPTGGTYLWSGPGLTNPFNQQSQLTVSPLNTSTYSVSYTQNGCTVNDSVIVNVIQNPTASVNNATICQGSSATLTASPPGGTYAWSDGTNNIGNGQSITVSPNENTNYTVSVTLANCPITSATSAVNLVPIPTITTIPSLTICNGQSTTISSSVQESGGTYEWTPVGSNSSVTVSPILQNSNIIDSFSFSVTYTLNGCQSNPSITVITVNPSPQIDAGQDLTICEGETITLNATGGSTINWSNEISNNTSFNPISSQEIIAIGIDGNNCSNSDTLNIIVNPNPQVNAGPDVFICEGDSVVLQGAGATFLEWTNSIINDVPFVPNQSETFVLNGEDINGCIGADSLTISVYPHADTTIIESSIGDYTWDVNNQTYSESGIYVGVIPNEFGCDSTITLNLTISSSYLSQISNIEKLTVFPNPNNGLFEILVGSELLNSNYTIFSSDGREIFNGNMTKQKETIVLPSTIEGGIYSVKLKNIVIRVVIVR